MGKISPIRQIVKSPPDLSTWSEARLNQNIDIIHEQIDEARARGDAADVADLCGELMPLVAEQMRRPSAKPALPGFIKLERRYRELPIWPKARRFTKWEAFIDLLFLKSWKPTKIDWGGTVVHVPANSVFRTQVELAERWRWSVKSVRRFICSRTMEKIWRVVTRRGIDHGYTLITFENSDTFEQEDQ